MNADDSSDMEGENQDDLRFENELKKLKLRAENGAVFMDSASEGLPPEIEAQFLNNIMEFENAAQNAKMQSVRDVLGDPKILPIDQVSEDRLEQEIKRLVDLMQIHKMEFTSHYFVSNSELYRFIVEELLDYEVQILDVENFSFSLIYEEFHPNHKEDIKSIVFDLVVGMIEGIEDLITQDMENAMSNGGMLEDRFVMAERILEAVEGVDMTYYGLEFPKFKLTEDKADVVCDLRFSATSEDSPDLQTHSMKFGFRFDEGFWIMDRFDMPSFGL